MWFAQIALLLLAQAAPPPKIVVKAAHLIDGKSDAVKDGYAVLIEGDRIVKVGPAAEVKADGARVIDLGNA